VVVLDAPLLLEPAAMAQGRLHLEFQRNSPLRLGLVPRAQPGAVRWFDAEASYVFHLVNAWEKDGAVIVEGCRIADPLIEDSRAGDAHVPRIGRIRLTPTLHRWRLDLRDGSLSECMLDDRWSEFPRTDDRALGEEAPFSIHPTIARRETLLFDGLMRRDTLTGRMAHFPYPSGCYGGEVSVVSGSPESSTRFLMVYVTNESSGRSELYIFDAEEPGEPVARVELPQRVPAGFHTRWVPRPASQAQPWETLAQE
jgi:carotenoid cleavage dioxygenase